MLVFLLFKINDKYKQSACALFFFFNFCPTPGLFCENFFTTFSDTKKQKTNWHNQWFCLILHHNENTQQKLDVNSSKLVLVFARKLVRKRKE